MKVSVDGTDIDVAEVAHAETLRDAVDCLRESGAVGESEIILEAALDGASCADTPAEDIGQIRLDGVEELDLETGSAREYGLRVLQDVGNISEFLRDAAGQVAVSLRNDPPQKSNGQLYRLLDSVHTLLTLLRCVDDAWGLEGMSLTADEDEVMARLTEALDGIEDEQKDGNWDGVAEYLDKDLNKVLQDIAGVVERTLRKVREGDWADEG